MVILLIMVIMVMSIVSFSQEWGCASPGSFAMRSKECSCYKRTPVKRKKGLSLKRGLKVVPALFLHKYPGYVG